MGRLISLRTVSFLTIGFAFYVITQGVQNLIATLGLPIPLTSVLIGFFIGAFPLWCGATFYVMDVTLEAITLFVNYPKYLVWANSVIIMSNNMLPLTKSTSVAPDLFVVMKLAITTLLSVLVGIGVISKEARRMFKQMVVVSGVIVFFFIVPVFMYFLYLEATVGFRIVDLLSTTGMYGFQNGANVCNIIVFVNMWITLASPFLVYLFFRRLGFFTWFKKSVGEIY